jgi:ABC-type sugar transport system substrate-binding protein
VIADEFPRIHVVGWQYGMADSAKVLAAAENLLTAYPDVAGMFASAESSSVGA